MLKTDFTLFKQNMEAVEKARSQKLSIIVTDEDAMVYLFMRSKQHAENYGRIKKEVLETERKYKQYAKDKENMKATG